jgi:hypothetical protein
MFGLQTCPWKFVILACAAGYSLQIAMAEMPRKSDGKSVSVVDSAPINLPSLHLHGKSDIHLYDSQQVHARYSSESAVQYSMDCGHEIPMKVYRDPELATCVKQFLLSQEEEELEQEEEDEEEEMFM